MSGVCFFAVTEDPADQRRTTGLYEVNSAAQQVAGRFPEHLGLWIPDEILCDEAANVRAFDPSIYCSLGESRKVGLTQPSRTRYRRITLKNTAVARMRT